MVDVSRLSFMLMSYAVSFPDLSASNMFHLFPLSLPVLLYPCNEATLNIFFIFYSLVINIIIH